jgi:energy-converting hydrogenase Eha subunit A
MIEDLLICIALCITVICTMVTSFHSNNRYVTMIMVINGIYSALLTAYIISEIMTSP